VSLAVVKGEKWIRPVALSGFGKNKNGRCGKLDLGTDEWVTAIRTFEDAKNGVTRVDISTNLGYFISVGKVAKGYKTVSYPLSNDSQIVGLFGKTTANKITKLGIIELALNCKGTQRVIRPEKKLAPSTTKTKTIIKYTSTPHSRISTLVNIICFALVILIIMCLYLYLKMKRAKKRELALVKVKESPLKVETGEANV